MMQAAAGSAQQLRYRGVQRPYTAHQHGLPSMAAAPRAVRGPLLVACSASSREEASTHAEPASSNRRGALLGFAAVAAAAAAAAGPVPGARAAAPPATAPDLGNRALLDYMEMESKGKLKEKRALDDFRGRYGIRRGVDGRVAVRGSNGDWYGVRLDMEVPGAMLLRQEKTGNVYAIETAGLSQVDLSDDYILLMMFADGAWEEEMAPIEFEDEKSGSVSQLSLQEREFREFVGLLKELEAQEGDATPSGNDAKGKGKK